MPIYEYQCTICGKVFDHLQSIKSEPLTHCLDQVCEQIEKGKQVLFLLPEIAL